MPAENKDAGLRWAACQWRPPAARRVLGVVVRAAAARLARRRGGATTERLLRELSARAVSRPQPVRPSRRPSHVRQRLPAGRPREEPRAGRGRQSRWSWPGSRRRKTGSGRGRSRGRRRADQSQGAGEGSRGPRGLHPRTWRVWRGYSSPSWTLPGACFPEHWREGPLTADRIRLLPPTCVWSHWDCPGIQPTHPLRPDRCSHWPKPLLPPGTPRPRPLVSRTRPPTWPALGTQRPGACASSSFSTTWQAGHTTHWASSGCCADSVCGPKCTPRRSCWSC
nr:uncharacterized protein LOC123281107 [Equus asinus]